MTRMLSELLGAKEPNFRLSLKQLEKSSGHPNADIRLSVDILHQSRDKIRELGLDPGNTTAEELFNTLRQRLLADEQRLREELGVSSGTISTEVTKKLDKFIKSLSIPRNCFALKISAAKKLLKKVPPKKAMKRLGYRSLDSMLKHEPVPQIYTAASLYEPAKWHNDLREAYGALSPSDFEARQIKIYVPQTKRWQGIVEEFAESRRRNSLMLKELGSIILLPVEADVPAMLLATVLMALKSVNEIRSASSFFKLQQVKPDFGAQVAQCVNGQPFTQAELSGFKLPWHFLHEFFESTHEAQHPALFEPHIQPEDLQLARAEKALSQKLPALEFWLGTDNLAFVDNEQIVSMNMLDVALAAANNLPLESAVTQNVHERIWNKLLASYLSTQNLERVTSQLSAELTGNELQPALEMETA